MDSPYARIVEPQSTELAPDGEGRLTAPRVEVPRRYNAALDFVERHLAEGRGERVAFLEDGRRTTYAELAERTARVATAVRGLGVVPEQRVMLCLHDTADFAAVFFGVLRAGAVAVPVSTLLTTEDYAFMLVDSRARVLFVSDALLAKVAPAISRMNKAPRVIVVSSPVASDGAGPQTGAFLGPGGSTRVSRTIANLELEAVLAASEPSAEAEPTTSDDVAFWLYSSGSTGRPKATVHLHSHLVQTAACYGRGVLAVREDDVVFSMAKLFFAYGLGNALTFPLHAGATTVLMAERPTPVAVMRVLEKYKPTLFFGVPTLFAAMLAEPSLAEAHGSPNLRVSVSAGEALPRHTGEAWRARFGTDVLDGIGSASTELLHIFLSNRLDDVRYGTSGKPVPGYAVKIVDDAGEPVADGVEGALWVSGPSSCVAYWNQREHSLATFHGPWTRTGDRYVRDADGYYTFCGRADDLLKVGGIWVSPVEVESALCEHTAVLEAAVVGHGDADGLVKPRAFIVLARGFGESKELADELKAYVRLKLAAYKYPRWIEFTAELPRTATGKVQRFKLRA